MSLKRLAIRGVAFNWVGRLCALSITFFLTPFLVTHLGKETYGVWTLVMTFAGYYALADFGMTGSLTKFVAEHHGRGEHDEVRRVVRGGLAFYCSLLPAVAAAIVAVVWAFPYCFDFGDVTAGQARAAAALAGLGFLLRFVAQPYSAVLTALVRFDLSNSLAVAGQLLQAGLMVGAVAAGYGVVGMGAALLVSAAVNETASLLVAIRLVPELPLSPRGGDRGTFRRLFSFSSKLILINGARRLTEHLGVLLAGLILGPAAAGFFSIADSLIKKTAALSRGVTSVVTPVASRMDGAGQRTELAQLAVAASRLLQTFGVALAVLFVFFGKELIGLWLGPDSIETIYPALCVLALANAATSISGGYPSLLIGVGRLRPLIGVMLLEAIATLVVGIMGAYWYGIVGLAGGILVVRVLCYGFATPWIACASLEIPWARTTARSLVSAAAVAAAGSSAAILFLSTIGVGDLFSLGLAGSVTASAMGMVGLLTSVPPGALALSARRERERRRTARKAPKPVCATALATVGGKELS